MNAGGKSGGKEVSIGERRGKVFCRAPFEGTSAWKTCVGRPPKHAQAIMLSKHRTKRKNLDKKRVEGRVTSGVEGRAEGTSELGKGRRGKRLH